MNGEDLKFLAHRAEGVRGRADRRVVEMKARIRSARRRRAVAALAATSTAMVALVIGIATLAGPTGENGDGRPLPPAKSGTPPPVPTRMIVWNEDLSFAPGNTVRIHVGTLHVGDREVEIDQTVFGRYWSMFVTDAGAVYAQADHSVWFTDGGSPRLLARKTCANSSGDYQTLGLATGNDGPLVAWFDCRPASRGDLVVYDTSRGREVARKQIPSCTPSYKCAPDAVVGDHVYVHQLGADNRLVDHALRLDLPSGRVGSAGARVYADDLRTHARALVLGKDVRSGTPTATRSVLDSATFRAVGRRLVPMSPDDAPTRAFDTTTGQRVRFRLPAGYHPDPKAGFDVPGDTDASDTTDFFTAFGWLDDDTLVLRQEGNNSVGDILACHFSDGRCSVAVKEAAHDTWRIVPGSGLPG